MKGINLRRQSAVNEFDNPINKQPRGSKVSKADDAEELDEAAPVLKPKKAKPATAKQKAAIALKKAQGKKA